MTQSGKPHALIHGNPRDDARMIEVASHCILPFRRQPFFRFRRPLARVRHFFPNQQAESIAPVKPARIFDLLMLANAVETESSLSNRCLFAALRLTAQSDNRPASSPGPGPFSVSRLAVEQKLAVTQFDAAQSDIRTNFVEQIVAVVKSDLQIVKMRRFRRPEFRVRNRDAESTGRNRSLIFRNRNSPAFFEHFDFNAPR